MTARAEYDAAAVLAGHAEYAASLGVIDGPTLELEDVAANRVRFTVNGVLFVAAITAV